VIQLIDLRFVKKIHELYLAFNIVSDLLYI